MTDNHVESVCRPGQGEKTCKYLATNTDGWVCAKTLPSVKAYIDDRGFDTMTAQADNCAGDPDFWPETLGDKYE